MTAQPTFSHARLPAHRSREDVIAEHAASCADPAAGGGGPGDVCASFGKEAAGLRVSRGAQRAIGSYMVTTPMGAERHYTLSYGDFRMRCDTDAWFKQWFEQVLWDGGGGMHWVGWG